MTNQKPVTLALYRVFCETCGLFVTRATVDLQNASRLAREHSRSHSVPAQTSVEYVGQG